MANYQSYKQIQGDVAVIANSLGPAQVSGFSTATTNQFYLCNGNHWNVNNGGCCCGWTVPGKTLTVRFELVSGGGSGSIGTCCSNGPGGSGGGYAVKTQFSHKGDFTPGSTQYTICAGGTTSCSCCGFAHGLQCCGMRGCKSYVTGGTLSNFCVNGGSYGYHQCGGGCYDCTFTTQCCYCWGSTSCFYGSDFGIRGYLPGRIQNQYCLGSTWSQMGGSPGPWGATFNQTASACSSGSQYGCARGHSLFPGGGGATPHTEGSCCWGGWGAGGLVVVTHYA